MNTKHSHDVMYNQSKNSEEKNKEDIEKVRKEELKQLEASTNINNLIKRKINKKFINNNILISRNCLQILSEEIDSLKSNLEFIKKKKDIVEKNYKLAEKKVEVEKVLLKILSSCSDYLPIVNKNNTNSLCELYKEIELHKVIISETEQIKNNIHDILQKIKIEYLIVEESIKYYEEEKQEITSIIRNLRIYTPLLESLKEDTTMTPFCYYEYIHYLIDEMEK